MPNEAYTKRFYLILKAPCQRASIWSLSNDLFCAPDAVEGYSTALQTRSITQQLPYRRMQKGMTGWLHSPFGKQVWSTGDQKQPTSLKLKNILEVFPYLLLLSAAAVVGGIGRLSVQRILILNLQEFMFFSIQEKSSLSGKSLALRCLNSIWAFSRCNLIGNQ